VSDAFGIHVTETQECLQCRTAPQSACMRYTKFFQMVSTTQWLRMWAQSGTRLGAEELIKRTCSFDERPCAVCSEAGVTGDVEFVTRQQLARPPQYYSLLWVWDGSEATADKIGTLLNLLPLTIDLSLIVDFETSSPFRIPESSTNYRLRCIVCFYSRHFVLIAYNPQVAQWVLFDDNSVRPLGAWGDVKEACQRSNMQPLVVFFERY